MPEGDRVKSENDDASTEVRQTLAARVASRLQIPLDQDRGPSDIPDKLVQLVAPLLGQGISLEAYRNIVILGMLGWNRTVLSDEDGEKMLREAVKPHSPQDEKPFRDLLDQLTQRKQQLFPGDRTLIVDLEARQAPDGSYYVAVVSGTMPDPETPGSRGRGPGRSRD
jgi:hypothetical protein